MLDLLQLPVQILPTNGYIIVQPNQPLEKWQIEDMRTAIKSAIRVAGVNIRFLLLPHGTTITGMSEEQLRENGLLRINRKTDP